eukprot:SAG22_NODE_171_length_16646_cov_6.580528_3_plen_146_part_00
MAAAQAYDLCKGCYDCARTLQGPGKKIPPAKLGAYRAQFVLNNLALPPQPQPWSVPDGSGGWNSEWTAGTRPTGGGALAKPPRGAAPVMPANKRPDWYSCTGAGAAPPPLVRSSPSPAMARSGSFSSSAATAAAVAAGATCCIRY